MILVDLDNFRLLAVEQGTFDFMCTLGSGNFYIDSSSEVTGLVSLNLFNLQIAFFGNAGSIDKVNAFLQNWVQQAFEEGGSECLGFGFGKRTGVFNFNTLNRAVCQIDANGTHAFCQFEVRLDNCCHAFRNGSHINSGHNRTAFESINYTVSNINSYADLRFNGGSTEVRSLYNIEQAQEGVIFFGKRLGRINVDSSAGNFTGFNALGNSFGIHAAAAGAVDNAHTVLHFGNSVCVQHFFGFFGERSVDGDVIGFSQQSVKINQLNANLMRTFFGNIRVITNGGHFHSLHTFGNTAADTADTNDTQGFALYLNAVKGFAVPFAFLNGLMGLRNVACHCHHHSNSVLGSSHGVAFRGVEYDNAFSGSGGDINVINANTSAADNLQTGGGFNNLLGYLGHAAGYQAIVIVDNLDKLLRFHVGHYIYIKMFAQQSYAFFADIVADKNFHGDLSSYYLFSFIYSSINSANALQASNGTAL